ncbi:hypothetical protein SNE40_017864 [Patella caerulea]|uniref:Cationic amino acid transporter n=1 Tax=Patella caerulea TaxID=87958 RepID=A0AAN8JD37_PATCE
MSRSNSPAVKPELKPQLTLWMLIVLGISSTVGSGIYMVIGIVAKEYAGPSVIISFIIAGLITLSNSMAYAELSSRFPGAGALYSYVHQCWGVRFGFLIGWLSILGNVAVVSLGAQTFSSYIESMIFNDSINRLNSTEYLRDVLFNNVIDIPASLVIIVSTVVIMSGSTKVAKLSTITSTVSVTSLIILTVTGFRNGDVRNLEDADHDSWIPFGFTGIIHGAAICYFAYTGFVTVCFSSEEAKNPKRSVPMAIGIVVVFVIFLYVGVTVAVLMIEPYWLLETEAPLLTVMHYAQSEWTKEFMIVGVTTGLIQVNLLCIYGLSRLVFSMARDGLLVNVLQGVYTENKSPVVSLIVCGVSCVLFSSVFKVKFLISFTNTVIFINSIVANILVLYVRCHPTPNVSLRTSLVSNIKVDTRVEDGSDLIGVGKTVHTKSSDENGICEDIAVLETTLIMSSSTKQDITEQETDEDSGSVFIPLLSSNAIPSRHVVEISDLNVEHHLSSFVGQLTSSPALDITTYLQHQRGINRREIVHEDYRDQDQCTEYPGVHDERLRKWRTLILLLIILVSCVFLAVTIILLALKQASVRFTDSVAPVLCGLALVYSMVTLHKMKSDGEFPEMKMPLVPFLPTTNILLDVLMLVILSDSVGPLYYMAMGFTGIVLYSFISRKNKKALLETN